MAGTIARPGAVALVTGASSGVGAATAVRLGREGMRVALVARRPDRLRETAKRVEAAGGEAAVIVADLADEAATRLVVEQAFAALGRVYILVNNAGSGYYGWFADMPTEIAPDLVAVNVGAVVTLTRMVLSGMLERGCGAIVTIGSVAGDLPGPGAGVYCASKAFLLTFSVALSRELRGTGIQVGIVQPGPVRTEFFQVAEQRAGLRPLGPAAGVAPERGGGRGPSPASPSPPPALRAGVVEPSVRGHQDPRWR